MNRRVRMERGKQIVLDGEEVESPETVNSGYAISGTIVPNRENNITFYNDTKSYG